MNRIQKKCFIAATGMHLLLVVILLVGPAFFSSRNSTDNLPTITFIPANLIDKPFVGGGPANPNPPPAQPLPPQPPQPPEPIKAQPKSSPPEVVKSEPKQAKPAPESLEVTTKPIKPKISTDLVTRKNTDTKTDSRNAQADAKRRADEISRTIRNLREGMSSSTKVESPAGFGGGGEAYASYALVVKSIYENAWIAPDNTTSDDATAKVTVTISSDGTVLSARISQFSGDEQTDASIQRTIDRVKFIAPFPQGAKETQRTYTISFNLKAKRLST